MLRSVLLRRVYFIRVQDGRDNSEKGWGGVGDHRTVSEVEGQEDQEREA